MLEKDNNIIDDEIIKEDISVVLDKDGNIVEDFRTHSQKKSDKGNFSFRTNIKLNKVTNFILLVVAIAFFIALFTIAIPIAIITAISGIIFLKIKQFFNKSNK